jgi:putative spermidine/putrescine transport system substrate-binding protein
MRAITRRSALAAGAATLAMPAIARAAEQVVVTTWGGDYGNLLEQNVEKPFLVPKGITVVHDYNDQNTRKTKLTTERMLKHGSYDVVHLSDTDMYKMSLLNVLSPVTEKEVPNLAKVVPALKKPYSIPHIFSAQVILYNEQKVTTKPKGFADLLNPAYKGKIGMPNDNYPVVTMGMAILGGGSMSNWEPAKKMLMEFKKLNPIVYPSQETLAQGLKSGEVWLAPDWLARGFMWNKSSIPVAHAIPEEGAIPVVFEAAVPKNARNPKGGFAYLNAMLEAKAQLGFSEKMGYGPTVEDATLPGTLGEAIGFTPEQEKKFRTPDFAYQAAHDSEILKFWNESFKA